LDHCVSIGRFRTDRRRVDFFAGFSRPFHSIIPSQDAVFVRATRLGAGGSFMRRSVSIRASFLFVTTTLGALASSAYASFIPPPGYEVVDLGIVAPSFGVSSSGRLATVTYSGTTANITLYDTYKTGRTVIGSASINAGGFVAASDITFASDNSLLVGENGTTGTLYRVDFSGDPQSLTSAVTKFADHTFNGIQSIAVKGNTVLVSGTDNTSFGNGDYYLRTLDLSSDVVNSGVITNGTIATLASAIQGNIGDGYVGGTAITAAGNAVLLQNGSDFFTGSAYVYDPNDPSSPTIASLVGGQASGAYGITIGANGVAYVTTGAEIRMLTGLDGSPVADTFGVFSEGAGGFPFPTGIAYTGGSFGAFDSRNTGALIVNGQFTSVGGLFAIQSLPEPTTLAITAVGGLLLLRRRKMA